MKKTRTPATKRPRTRRTATPTPPVLDPGPGYRLLGDDEPLLAGDQINDTDGTWQKPLRRDDPPTLRQRRKNLSTPESCRAWPGRAAQIQVRRPLPAPAPTAAPTPTHLWRELAPGEPLQPGDEVTARSTDDLQAPAGTQLWIAHHPGDPSLGQPVPARTACRYRRLEPAPAIPAPTALPVASPSPGPGHRLLGDDDILRPGDERTRLHSYAGAWEPVGATLHGLTTRAARRVYSPHNAEGQPDPLHFRRPYHAPDRHTPLALPPGARELAPGERILPTDHYLWGREWLPRAGTRNLGRPYHPGQNRLTIRPLAPAEPTYNPVLSSSTAAPAPSAALLHAHTDAATAAAQASDTPSPPPPHAALRTPLPCEPGYRALAPHEIIQPGDEWKCDGTGCPTYRTLNPHHGRTVAEVNAHRSPDLPRHYRRKLPEPPAAAPTPTAAEPAPATTHTPAPADSTTLQATTPSSAASITPPLSGSPSSPDHPGQLYLAPDLAPAATEKLLALAYHTTLPEHRALRVAKYTDGTHAIALTGLPTPVHLTLPAELAAALQRALAIVQ